MRLRKLSPQVRELPKPSAATSTHSGAGRLLSPPQHGPLLRVWAGLNCRPGDCGGLVSDTLVLCLGPCATRNPAWRQVGNREESLTRNRSLRLGST